MSAVEEKVQYFYRVTNNEFQRFLANKTFLPACMSIGQQGMPDCEEQCPKGLTCALFSYLDEDNNLEIDWFACAPADVLAELASRALPYEPQRAKRKIKYIAYVP